MRRVESKAERLDDEVESVDEGYQDSIPDFEIEVKIQTLVVEWRSPLLLVVEQMPDWEEVLHC